MTNAMCHNCVFCEHIHRAWGLCWNDELDSTTRSVNLFRLKDCDGFLRVAGT